MSIICRSFCVIGLERHALIGLQRADQAAGVLGRKQPLGHEREQHDVQADRGEQDQHHQAAVAQRPGQASARSRYARGRISVRRPRAVVHLARFEPQRAHHRRGGERDRQRDEDGDRQRDREFAEQPAENAAHQQDRNEHRDQRQADRQHGEADFPRAAQRRLQPRHAGFEVARDVLQHDDGVVDHEAGGDGQRHQRQNVEAIAQQIHAAERAEDGNRHGDARE